MSLMRQKFWSYIQLVRLDKPIGIWLVLFPAMWSLIWVSPDYHTFFHYIPWLSLGAVAARSAGCVLNDAWDKNFDALVKRTAQRPLAAGKISKIEFLVVLFIFAILAMGVLLQFNQQTIIWGCMVVPLIILYPLMKRWTYWPQLFLAITFNWGAFMASTAVVEQVTLGSFVIYIACACWAMAYDTVYAHQDAAEDLHIGVKSTALRFGKDTKFYVAGFMTLFFLSLMLLFIQRSWGGFTAVVLVLLWGLELKWLREWLPEQTTSSQHFFLRQNIIGWGITLAIILPLLWP